MDSCQPSASGKLGTQYKLSAEVLVGPGIMKFKPKDKLERSDKQESRWIPSQLKSSSGIFSVLAQGRWSRSRMCDRGEKAGCEPSYDSNKSQFTSFVCVCDAQSSLWLMADLTIREAAHREEAGDSAVSSNPGGKSSHPPKGGGGT